MGPNFDLTAAKAGFANGGAQNQANNDFSHLAPYVTTASSTPTASNQVIGQTKGLPGANTGVMAKFGSFLGELGHETGHLATGAADWLAHWGAAMATSPYHIQQGVENLFADNTRINNLQTQTTQNSGQLKTLFSQYQTGKIDHTQFTRGLNSLVKQSGSLAKQGQDLNTQVTTDKANTAKAFIDVTSAVLTVMTVGADAIAGAAFKIAGTSGIDAMGLKTTAEWLGSEAAKPLLEPLAGVISKMSVDSTAFKALDGITQGALQKATAEVVSNGASTMTGAQLARATVTNIAFKYPITFNYMSSTANQVYQELDQAKYGPAVQQIGFNALLLLSGGPIGQALKFGGKALSSVVAHTFGEPAFWDNLSMYYGDKKTPDGFVDVIKAIHASPELLAKHGYTGATAQKDFLRDVSSVPAINVAAMKGDVAAGAGRVAKGMQNQYSFDLSTVSHQEGLSDMLNYVQSYRETQLAATKAGLGTIAIGRADVRDMQSIAKAVGSDASTQQANLDAWIAQNGNTAAANSPNLYKQLSNIIKEGGDVQGRIAGVDARQTLKGMDQAVINKLAKRGYVPMGGKNEAPYIEGAGTVKTAFAQGEPARSFFVQATQPLPVLGSVGSVLTKLGMSPFASTERSYQLFNDSVARNLSDTNAAKIINTRNAEEAAKSATTAKEIATAPTPTAGFTKAELAAAKKAGVTPEMMSKGTVSGETSTQAEVKAAESPVPKAQLSGSDYILKKLSDAAKSLKTPVNDFRLLTNKQVRDALNIGYTDAADVQYAIAKAHLQVPLAVKGLGAAAVDTTLLRGTSVVARRYLKIQGALRFTMNPFYQYLRLIPKTEILTEAEGGGFFHSLFTGRMSEVSNIRAGLRDNGMFAEKSAQRGSITGEAAGASTLESQNLGHKLVSAQEISISGLIDAQAQKLGLSWQDYIKQYPNQTADTIQAIAEYSRNSQFLNSPLAKTLNVAFFPFRFDAKVAGIMAKSLGRQDLMIQVSVVNGLIKSNDWMKTDQGMAWYSQNATAIQLFKYITPLASLNEVFQSLLPGHDHSLGNFGELGGLPFGWIPMITDQAGLTNFNQAGVDAKTGQTIPKYVSASDKGTAAIAIQDLISTLFSYPGAEIGLPSKTSLTRSAALGLTEGNKKTDLKLETPTLNPQQQHYQDVVKGQQQAAMTPAPTQTPIQTVNVPSTGPTTAAPKYKNGTSSPSAKKLKKSQQPVSLLPGQSVIGQL